MNTNDDYSWYIINNLPARDRYEQLAEEASELAKASLKMIRACGMSGNVTPVSEQQAIQEFEDELVDVMIAISALNIDLDGIVEDAMESEKWKRWWCRLNGKEHYSE